MIPRDSSRYPANCEEIDNAFIAPSSAFTLIELLVVIAIIAILAVVVVLTLNPAQLLAQSRDANRVSDLATLSSAIGLYQTDVAGASIGSSSTTYPSIPSASSTCGDLGLITLPSGYSYYCSSSAKYRSIDGSGWIPIDFREISSGAPFGSLPVDPSNKASANLYYTYTVGGSQYELTADLESLKYASMSQSDGGIYNNLYEKGTNLALLPVDYNAQRAPVFVQAKGECYGPVETFTTQVRGGDLIIDSFLNDGGTQPTPTDTLGTHLALVASETTGPNNLWVFAGIAPSSGSDTINNIASSYSWQCMGIMEAANLTGVVKETAIRYSGISPNTTTITTTNGDTFIYAAIGGFHDADTFTPVSGFTDPSGANAGGNDAIGQAYSVSSAGGSDTAGFTIGGAGTDNSPLVVVGFQ
jgi:prepilin-type N-terminal cleavage/methylation domain-containing protein